MKIWNIHFYKSPVGIREITVVPAVKNVTFPSPPRAWEFPFPAQAKMAIPGWAREGEPWNCHFCLAGNGYYYARGGEGNVILGRHHFFLCWLGNEYSSSLCLPRISIFWHIYLISTKIFFERSIPNYPSVSFHTIFNVHEVGFAVYSKSHKITRQLKF